VAGTSGQFERATRLFGAAEMLLAGDDDNLDPANRSVYDRSIAALRARLGDGAFAAAWVAGRALTLEQAIACALEG